MTKETKDPNKLPWEGDKEFDKYLDTYLKNTFKGMMNGTRNYIAIPFHEEFEEKFENDDRYINVLLPLYTAFLNDALYTSNREKKNLKLLSLWFHVQEDVVTFSTSFPEETERFMLIMNLAVIDLVWKKYQKLDKKKNKKK